MPNFRKQRILGFVLKSLFTLLIVAVNALIIWRVAFSARIPDSVGTLHVNDALREAYEQTDGALTAQYQNQLSTTYGEDNAGYFGVPEYFFLPEAKQVQVAQSAGRLTSKRVMKNSSIARMDRIIFEYHLAYADEPRPAAYKDEWGRIHNASFRRYDFLEYDEYTGEWYYDDRYLFSVDSSANVEADRPQIWEMNMQNFAQGLFGPPQDVASLVRYWQAQEEAHYPNARRQVEYFQQQYLQQQAAAMQQMPAANDVASPMMLPQGGK